jgi:hypothetical protein
LGRASAGRLANRGSDAAIGRRIGVSGIPRFSAVISFASAAASGIAAVVDETSVEGVVDCGIALVFFLADMAGSCSTDFISISWQILCFIQRYTEITHDPFLL